MSFVGAGFLAPYHHPNSFNGSPKDKSARPSPKDEYKTQKPNAVESSSPISAGATQGRTSQNRKRLVFADPVAFRYLEEDPATDAIERWRRLEGYEMYVVEQWACSRSHPTFIICTYTGDPSHSILVNVLAVPSDESTWSQRLQVYFQAVSQYHAKEKDTPLGALMVTNLSGFPSALTVIPVPDGDVRKHRDDFIVNEDLKRMGCSGRAGINLQPPQSSTVAKFHHLYRTSEAVPLYQSVMELVRTCQIALVMYDKLQPTYADGLLCDVTERAVNDWWTDIGTYFYNVEPSDGILGPTTVAALLGLLIGAYNRLKAFGSPVGKDVLDTVSMKRAIGHFQKGQKMEKTRRLDRETLDRLHRATAKNASGEGWTVPKAVKSTVAELSGKGGEMVMGIVGGRDKAGISEAETMDIERFAQLVTGPKMKWLWQGKPIKSGDPFAWPTGDLDLQGRVFSTDDQGNFLWTGNQHDSTTDGNALERTDTMYTNQSDTKSGRHRLRGAVGGLRSYNHRYQKDIDEGQDWVENAVTRTHLRENTSRTTTGIPPPSEPRAFDMALVHTEPGSPHAERRQPLRRTQTTTEKRMPSHREQLRPALPGDSPRRKKVDAELADLRNEFKADIYRNFSAAMPYKGPSSLVLRRTQSNIQLIGHTIDSPRQDRINRRLSFSVVESAVLDTGKNIVEEGVVKGKIEGDLTNALAERDALVASAQKKAKRIQRIQQGLIPYTESRVNHVESLDRIAHQHLEELNELYYQRLEEYQTLQATSSDLVSQEKTALTESFRRMEMLGAKMDYELDSLQSRLQEVEDGVDDFERNVLLIEARARELNGEDEGPPPGSSWIARMINFLGTKK
ncbi:uncharacterized protein Z520_01299 [Fonsecaea multimorphosa CBS 102226]|uniref:STB6-like N-terminal domain-containing protein n=1 Tax=Fonsecaea multimorphosa CBS 102226 TaxID=1442371 RepID=A0A0D2L1B7_9EURO|nr:uncharacterized protein Z520_01299 [Fonsecaea multimorphosa CBS 102226]KIY02834.1 hypothetical protein Z520_01299 [Fonsecaea multimorphosa CBS 102226]OAL30997.1 hypothetical protein AYO22_01292 [Fonsecaea multimorphosa]